MKEHKPKQSRMTVAAGISTAKRYAKSILPRTRNLTTEKQQTIISPEELHERIARKSYELFEQRGCVHGNDQKDWFEAERIVFTELAQNRN